MAKKILLVDDLPANRKILKAFLLKDYEIAEAENGEEALSIIRRDLKLLSAVLLDIQMPVMDGYEVLRLLREDALFSQLPIIVVTGSGDDSARVKALAMGANDFVTKPYNPEIIRHCLRNNIALSETASIVDAMRRDKLTGVYNRTFFFQRVDELIQSRSPGAYIMACLDIDNFKLVNEQYGAAEGDRILRYVGNALNEAFTRVGGFCGRISGDIFAALFPNTPEATKYVTEGHNARYLPKDAPFNMLFSVGYCVVSDCTLTASAVYDRAYLAKQSVKGRYDQRIAYFDDSMFASLLRTQEIAGEMSAAIKQRQFEVWLQPQYNHATGSLIGAEALARWRHPRRGLIPPSDFIPIFEQNGFIFELDKFIWKETCRCLRRWLDEGRDALPVSVNISRCDVLREELVDTLTGLLKMYRLSASLLRLEITESAFSKSTDQIVAVVRKLLDLGFTIEIDDFGSGYSSLNTLKDVPAQILKLDMRFLEENGDSRRAGNIIESVVRMANWLGMSVIAEGVETQEQADYLQSIGCVLIQGYYYARPMPVADYEALAVTSVREKGHKTIQTIESMNVDEFWNPFSIDTLVFSSYVGGACVAEITENRCELVRVNQKYLEALRTNHTADEVLRFDPMETFSPEDRRMFYAQVEEAVQTGGEFRGEVCKTLIRDVPVHMEYVRYIGRVIARTKARKIVYILIENITKQKMAAAAMEQMLRDMPVGYVKMRIAPTGFEPVFINDGFCRLCGMTREELSARYARDIYAGVHPDDQKQMKRVISEAVAERATLRLRVRLLRGGGDYVLLQAFYRVTEEPDGSLSFSGYYTDADESDKLERQRTELLDNLPCGAVLYEYDGHSLSVLHLNERYRELVGRGSDTYPDDTVLNRVHPDDRELVKRSFFDAMQGQRYCEYELRIRTADDVYKPFRCTQRMVEESNGKFLIYSTYTPVSADAASYREMLPVALAKVVGSSNDMVFIKDKNLRYICCNRAFALVAGLTDEKEIIGKTDFDLLPEKIAKMYTEADNEVLASGKALLDIATHMPTPSSAARYASISKYPLPDANGDIIGLYAILHDTTREREKDSQLKLLTDSIPGGLTAYTAARGTLRLTYFNDGLCALFGYDREAYQKLAANDPFPCVLAQDAPRLRERFQSLLQKDDGFDEVARFRRADGCLRWLNCQAAVSECQGENLDVTALMMDVTERYEAIERLRVSEEENRLAIQHSGNIICRFDIAKHTLTIPPEAAMRHKMPEVLNNVPYGQVESGDVAPGSAKVYVDFFESIIKGQENGEAVYEYRTSEGWRWKEAHFSMVFDDAGKPLFSVVSFMDVTDRVEKEAIVRKWQQSLNDKKPETYSFYRCNVSKDAIYDLNEGLLLDFSFDPARTSFNDRARIYVMKRVVEEDREKYLTLVNTDRMLASYYRGNRYEVLEYRERSRSGSIRWVKLTIELVEFPNSTDVAAYLLYEDIDRSKREELMTRERAETDRLTGLLNRQTFIERMSVLLGRREKNAFFALLMLDLDGFKQVNDNFGHAVGDETLVEVGTKLRGAVRSTDLVCRLGGDEFMVCLCNVRSRGIVAQKAKQLCALLRKPFSLEVQVSVSIGIAVNPSDGEDFEELYRRADLALYHVKETSKDTYAFYSEDMNDEAPHPLAVAEALSVGGDRHAELKRRMLIVDDNVSNRTFLANIFRDQFIVDTAEEGGAALIRLRRYGSAISIVLLDLMMPGMDGFAVLDKMRESPEMQTIPVIVVSGMDERDTSLRAIKNGASDFITKPVDADLLRLRVASAISKTENERLRAQNRYLAIQNDEVERYRAMLDNDGTVFAEWRMPDGTFTYDRAFSIHIAGTYNGRSLWDVLAADHVAGAEDIRRLKQLSEDVFHDDTRTSARMDLPLRTPSDVYRIFCVKIIKRMDAFSLRSKLILSFTEKAEC